MKCFKFCGCGNNGKCSGCGSNSSFIGFDPRLSGSYFTRVNISTPNTDERVCRYTEVDVNFFFYLFCDLVLN